TRSSRTPGRHDDAPLGACRQVDMRRVASGLCNELQVRQALDHRAGKARALLRKNHRVNILQTLSQPRRISFRIIVNDQVMAAELGKALKRPKGILIVVDDRDFHIHISFLLNGSDGRPALRLAQDRRVPPTFGRADTGVCPYGSLPPLLALRCYLARYRLAISLK